MFGKCSHKYGSPVNRIQTCAVCGKAHMVNCTHQFGPEVNGKQTCAVCGIIETVKCFHQFKEPVDSKQTCAICGKVFSVCFHKYRLINTRRWGNCDEFTSQCEICGDIKTVRS